MQRRWAAHDLLDRTMDRHESGSATLADLDAAVAEAQGLIDGSNKRELRAKVPPVPAFQRVRHNAAVLKKDFRAAP